MKKRARSSIELNQEVSAHLRAIERKHHNLIFDAIEEQLSFEPDVETTNRKPMRRPTRFGDKVWEIRFGPGNRFRVFYDFDAEALTVQVHAVAVKIGNRIYIGHEEIEL
jgi:mRNA-degrading endonuclease RelE of RelBE toxin-antitoxin system